ncbi:hypothetical protein B0H34DRAFT_393891 [Crassisporium funariophilum]|nr:hypothetical protein B0H34DRAFT_393891 [Crassisporium funariophilum]
MNSNSALSRQKAMTDQLITPGDGSGEAVTTCCNCHHVGENISTKNSRRYILIKAMKADSFGYPTTAGTAVFKTPSSYEGALKAAIDLFKHSLDDHRSWVVDRAVRRYGVLSLWWPFIYVLANIVRFRIGQELPMLCDCRERPWNMDFFYRNTNFSLLGFHLNPR